MTCIDCKFHGPPVSDYRGPKPCADCIPYSGFPKWEPVVSVLGGVARLPFKASHAPRRSASECAPI